MREPLKIAMVTRDYPPKIGGVSTVVGALVIQLRRMGVHVDVYEGKSNLRTSLLPLHEVLRGRRYDVIHIQSGPFGGLVSKHPMVVAFHSPLLEEAKYYAWRNLLRVPLAYVLERRTIQIADAVTADSVFAMRALIDGYGIDPKKVTLIPLGVDSEQFSPGIRTVSTVSKILMCSRLDPRKNIGEALEAVSGLDTRSYELTIVGDGPERARLEGIAKEMNTRTKFLGFVDQNRLRSIFAEANIFLSTSSSEGFGLSVLQAMASGCAMLVSNIPTHRELVTHMRDGLIYSDSEQLTGFLGALLRDPSLAMKLGAKAREKAVALSWERTARETISLYDQLLGKN